MAPLKTGRLWKKRRRVLRAPLLSSGVTVLCPSVGRCAVETGSAAYHQLHVTVRVPLLEAGQQAQQQPRQTLRHTCQVSERGAASAVWCLLFT